MANPPLRAPLLRDLLVPLACLAAAAAPGAQVRRLNPPFELESLAGGVLDGALHPNGSQVLFRVSASLPGVLDLHAAPIAGGSSLAIVTLAADRSVESYAFTPNGQWVVYVADAEHDDRLELFSHRVGTPGSTRISGTLVSQGDVREFACAPSSARVVYRADAEADGRDELYSVAVAGGSPPVRLNDALFAGQRVLSFRVAPAGGRAAFAQRHTNDVVRLYSRALDGSGALALLAEHLASSDAAGYAFTPDGARVVFLHEGPVLTRLYSAPADGSAPAIQLDALPGVTNVTNFRLSPDGEEVVFTARHDGSASVFSTPVAGGGPVRALAPEVAGDTGSDVSLVALAPDSSRVAFAFRPSAAAPLELRSAPLDGSAPSVLLDTLDALAGGEAAEGSQRLVYLAGVPTGFGGVEARELRSVRLDGAGPFVRLDAAGGAPLDFALSPDGARALYRWLDDDDDAGDGAPLWSAPLDGSSAGALVHAGEVHELAAVRGAEDGTHAYSPDGADAVFVSFADGASWLVAADAATGANARTLSGTLAHDTFADVGAAFDLRAFELRAGEPDALFVADPAVDQRFELFAADVAPGSGPRTVVGGLDVDDFASTADGATVVFVSGGALHAAPRDGSAPPVELASGVGGLLESKVAPAPDGARAAAVTTSGLLSLPLGGGAATVLDPGVSVASWPSVSPDSQWCVYLRREGILQRLFVVPLAGGAPPAALTAPGGETVQFSSVSFAGGDVLFTVGLNGGPGAPGVYRAALDGSTPRVLLSGATAPSFAARLSPDGGRVVFRAQSSSPGGLELFAAPADGSGAPVRLSAALPTDAQRVVHFEATADSQSVVYVCDQAELGRFELFVAPLDGSAAPLRLNAPLPLGGDACRSPFDVVPFALDAPAGRVVYFADQEVDERFELWVAALDGSSPPRRLSGELVEGGDVGHPTDGSSFALSPDARGVVYCADQESDGRFDLWWARLDGGPARRLTQALAKPGCEGKFRLTADSQRVVYQATERSGVRELFSAPLERRPDAKLPPFRRDR